MTRTCLLIVTNLGKISKSLKCAQKHVTSKLYVQIYSAELPGPMTQSRPPNVSHAISQLYTMSTQIMGCTEEIDVRVIIENLKTGRPKKFQCPIDVLLFDNCFRDSDDSGNNERTNILADKILEISDDDESDMTVDNNGKINFFNQLTVYDNVVVGGTFDRLHVGHKMLLSEAVLRAKKRLVVGVTDTNMVKTKKLRELILPVQQRIDEVREFLMDIDSTLQYDIVPIQDIYGPTKWDPNLDLLIVSAETMKGGEAVNKLRAETNLPKLSVHCIDLVELKQNCNFKETKISSSNQRIDLLGTRMENKSKSNDLPIKAPYIIGMVGGIASGKSDMSQRFGKLGAKIIDCDKLAHQLYEPKAECYNEIVQCFGKEILNGNECIDRRRLGEIVFSNPNEMEKLNQIVWPALLCVVKEKIREAYETEHSNVVIIEAAVLIKAGWQRECHEIWSTILSRDETIKRLMQRNKLSEIEAVQRIDAQISNDEIVKASSVVFSSQWGFEFSQQQAEKAWQGLREHLMQFQIQI